MVGYWFYWFSTDRNSKSWINYFLAKYFADKGDDLKLFDMVVTLLITGVLMFLIAKQPDLGSSLVLLAVWFGMLVATSISRKYIY